MACNPPSPLISVIVASSISEMQSHRIFPSGVQRSNARWPIANLGCVPIPMSPGSYWRNPLWCEIRSALYHNINVNEDRQAGADGVQGVPRRVLHGEVLAGVRGAVDRGRRPKECAEQLRAYFAAGLGHMALRLASWDQAGQLARFLGEVAPAL